MSRDSRTIFRFATIGIAVAVAFFAYLKSNPPDNWVTMGAFWAGLILSPGYIPFFWAMAVEMQPPGLLVMWLITAGINFVIYSIIGAVYGKLRSWQEETSTTY